MAGQRDPGSRDSGRLTLSGSGGSGLIATQIAFGKPFQAESSGSARQTQLVIVWMRLNSSAAIASRPILSN
jgi:hypothetical protein